MQTTLVQIGRVVGQAGALLVAYSPERQWIQLFASDPKDRRRTGISLILTHSEYRQLKRLLDQLEGVMAGKAEIVQNNPQRNREVSPIPGTQQVSVGTSFGKVVVSNAVHEMVVHIAATQSREKALSFLQSSLSGTSPDAVAEALSELLGQ